MDAEKKNRGFSWLYIVALLLFLLVLAILFWPKSTGTSQDDVAGLAATEAMTAPDDAYATDDRTGGTAAMARPVRSYVEWSATMAGSESDRAFTRNGLMSLADALAAVVERAPNLDRSQINNKLSTMREKAGALSGNWESTAHASKIREAFRAGADVFEELQQRSFPDLKEDVQALRSEIQRLEAQALTQEQKNRVKDVFREASDVLQKMEQRRGR